VKQAEKWALDARPFEITPLPARLLAIMPPTARPVARLAARLDLTRFPWARSLLLSRWPQFLLRAITLAGFVFTILAGLFGSVVGSHNFAIIFVWIAWWTALKLFFIPFGGRSWCSICPIPMPGEWLQHGGILQPRGKGIGLGRRWPKALGGSWLQAGSFLMVGLFGAVTLTSAKVTAVVLLGIIILALVLSLVFERRSFCNTLCPIGGFTGLYAQAGPVEVRVKDPGICAAHAEKTCYTACPWGQYPLALKSSATCGLCMECLRVCPSDNIAVNLRPWGSDLGPKTKHRLDEAFLGLVMLASALVDSAVFLGPWGQLKSAAYAIGSPSWFLFSGVFLTAALGVLPGLYAIAVWISMRVGTVRTTLRQALAHSSQVLVPLGLMAWIAFTVSFAFAKFSYVLPVVSDPLGWGWNLIGMTGKAWVGQTSSAILLVQVILLAVGLFWASRVARRITASNRQALPLIAFSGVFSLGMLWLLVG
jgi:polyferredoxin